MSTPTASVDIAQPMQTGSRIGQLEHTQAELTSSRRGRSTFLVMSAVSANIPHEYRVLPGGTTAQNFFYLVVKRVLDIVISLTALIACSPIFLLAAVAIRLCDRGPVFFCQKRVGRDGRAFQCFKLRSMIVNAHSLQETLSTANSHNDARTFKMTNDPRITPVGKFLRRFSIDELPQFLNVLYGDMSVVGPRPPLPGEVALYSEADRKRLTVKPGLTCIWQISGRSRLPFSEQARLDVEYIQKHSVLLDLEIILRTIPAVLSGDGAA